MDSLRFMTYNKLKSDDFEATHEKRKRVFENVSVEFISTESRPRAN